MSRRGKIVCPLGPATQSDELILALVEAGMDVARLNFSHGDYADHKAAYERVRAASDATGRAVYESHLAHTAFQLIPTRSIRDAHDALLRNRPAVAHW